MSIAKHSLEKAPFARNRVIYYLKVHRWIARELERGELERQWNELGIYR